MFSTGPLPRMMRLEEKARTIQKVVVEVMSNVSVDVFFPGFDLLVEGL